MYDYKLSETAYAKMLFHAAKYPHLAVNGVLLAEKSTATTTTSTTKSLGTIEIIDAMPLFHQCLHVTPMYEVALVQIDSYAEARNMVIAGYYCAHENFYHNGLDKAPAVRIADKIYENNESACFVVIDNKLLTLKQQQPAVHFYAVHQESGGWTKAQFALQDKQSTLEAVSKLLQRGAQRDVIDFDMYLDNPKNDWTNKLLNTALEKLLGMY